MNLNWLRDQECHDQFKIFWERGNGAETINEADYFTNYHPTKYH